MKLLIFVLCFLVLSSPAFADSGLTWGRGGYAVLFHIVMNIFVLNKIWRRKAETRLWQISWSLISLLALVIGPFLFLGLATLPAEIPREERFSGGSSASGVVSFSMGMGGVGAEGIPEVSRLIDGEEEPDEKIPHSKLATEARHEAAKGGAKAQTHYGTLLEYGDGTAQDFRAAARWYRRAADQGFAPAQAYLAGLYAKGHGVERSAEEALFWMCLAAERDPHYATSRDAYAANLPADRQDAMRQRAREWRAENNVVTTLKMPA